MKRLLVTLILAATPQAGAAYDDKTIVIEGAPISLSDFNASYYQGSGSYPRPSVNYRLKVENISDKKIVAYQVGLMAFDAFKEPLGRGLNGYSIQSIMPNMNANAAWEHTVLEAGLFEKYGMGVAYPLKVRFEDGSIWEADRSIVLDQLREIEDSLTLEDLGPKKE